MRHVPICFLFSSKHFYIAITTNPEPFDSINLKTISKKAVCFKLYFHHWLDGILDDFPEPSDKLVAQRHEVGHRRPRRQRRDPAVHRMDENGRYAGSIAENLEPGTEVITVTATDRDEFPDFKKVIGDWQPIFISLLIPLQLFATYVFPCTLISQPFRLFLLTFKLERV